MDTHVSLQIHNFVVDTFLLGDGSQLTDDSSFIEDGLIDSTGILELVSFLEEQYGISVADSELVPDNLDSVNRVSTYLRGKLSETRPQAALSHVA